MSGRLVIGLGNIYGGLRRELCDLNEHWVEDLVDIAESGEIKKMILVEDNFYGFRVINKAFLNTDVPMVFGVKLPVVQSSCYLEKPSKLIFFPKNNKGVAMASGWEKNF